MFRLIIHLCRSVLLNNLIMLTQNKKEKYFNMLIRIESFCGQFFNIGYELGLVAYCIWLGVILDSEFSLEISLLSAYWLNFQDFPF